jgi:putative DNA primase/helicase
MNAANGSENTNTRHAAERYLRAGLAVIPVPGGTKNPNRPGWQHERWTVEDVPRMWDNGQGVGMLLGEPSRWLVDVDLDAPEARKIAGRFLPPTKTSGRTSSPDSHWWYRAENTRSRDFTDLKGEKLVELRSTGRQTLVQPSVHPESGERCCWSDSGLDTEYVSDGELLTRCREVATSALIARTIPPAGRGRHDIALALAGFLLRRGLSPEMVVKIMLASWDAAGYPDDRARREAQADLRGAVSGTAAKLQGGQQASGGRRLDQLVPGMARKIADYWDWSSAENGHANNGKAEKLSTHEVAEAITAEDHFAQDQGGKLYRFSGGTYNQYAERFIRRRVKEVLESSGRAAEWSSHRANEVIEYIRADAPELWERPPLEEVNVLNGILRLDTRELREHDPAYLSPVQVPVNFDPEAECPEWERFIGEVFPEDARELPFEIAADLITPSRSAQKALLLLGEGSNGKSTYLRALTTFVGSPNTCGASLHKLESDRFATARLIGKLANICPDLPSTHLTETSVFKAITGGDDLHAEYKYRESFEFSPYCRLVFSANHVPHSSDASHAFFRRWLVVPFNRTFEPGEAIPREELDAKLSDPHELSGVLNRALDVLPRVRHEGFTESESMREAWEEFKSMTDPVSVWLSRSVVVSTEAFVPKSALLAAYNADCEDHGRAGMTATAFGLAVKRARPGIGDAQRTVNGKPRVKVWIGLGLKGGGDDDGGDGGDSSSSQSNQGNPVNPVSLTVSNSGPGEQEREGETQERNRENPVNSVTLVTEDGGSTPDTPCVDSIELRKKPGWMGHGPELTSEQAEKVKRLIHEGMSPKYARAEILGEKPMEGRGS